MSNGNKSLSRSLEKAPTGIAGLDQITRGGLPAHRPTLVCGGAGCGKTILAMEFLVRGAAEFDEPGLFISFEESPRALTDNLQPLGLEIEELTEQGRLKLSHVHLSPAEIVETGDFQLDPLRMRLEQGIREIGAKRVALDSLDSLFSALTGAVSLRAEVARLFGWIRESRLTTLVTAERGEEHLTRNGFEEYLSDCVLLLDHRITDQIAKRRLRVVKYRGSGHGLDEYPFLIGEKGLTVAPITSVNLNYEVASTRISSGISDLDRMLEGKGYFRGSSVLISGKAGTGKSSVCASFLEAACRQGERCLYLALEESSSQLMRNMRSLGVDLESCVRDGLLTVRAFRPTLHGMEEHLSAITAMIHELNPTCIVMDPITNFITVGIEEEVRAMLTRVLDHFKSRGLTVMVTALTPGSAEPMESETNVSSMIDTWITLDWEIIDHTRHRMLSIVKSRGMDHSHTALELLMSSDGLSLRELEEGRTDE